ncbi:Wzz/FepE/Etk N-terminal domain-containing protein [Catellatospora sichuanensis]|uniref:Wzz/FepE/Etk N-terminal domain-containing protein n=1 Tax=Catellatospora sichuanensis TaxID=1969805 RepID=UPI001183E97C|nr:Wzz/FepE/Etk N-terminal domain-containing protein [Catellatospora sichuanensis]
MDLLTLFATLRRHRWATLVVMLVVIVGEVFVVFMVPTRYETSAVYVLVQPPPAPTEAQILANPALGKLNSDNPLLRVDPYSLVEVVSQRMSSDLIGKALVAQGADEDYKVEPSNQIGGGSILLITGTGTSAEASVKTLDLVTSRMLSEFNAMQLVNQADARFLIQAQLVSKSETEQKLTGTLRSVIVVFVAGLVLLFAVISIAEARKSKPKQTTTAKATGVADAPQIWLTDLAEWQPADATEATTVIPKIADSATVPAAALMSSSNGYSAMSDGADGAGPGPVDAEKPDEAMVEKDPDRPA